MKARTSLLLASLAVAGLAYWLRPRRESLRGKVAVITGGSRGLGLAMAEELARQGARLEIIARDAEELQRAATHLRAFGASVNTRPCDVTDDEQVRHVLRDIATARGSIDLLINNAGVILVAPLENMEAADFEEALRLHFWAPYHTTHAALPYLKESKGRVVNIASIGGRLAVPHLAPYSVSKFALVGLSDALRAELRKDGVSVTTASPGLMRTGSHIHAKFKGDHDKEFTWFSLGATLPFISIDAHRAARQIIAATQRRQPELTITLQARLAVIGQAIFPNLFARIMDLVTRLLPGDRPGAPTLEGRECRSLVPSFLTTLGDQAGRELNEKH